MNRRAWEKLGKPKFGLPEIGNKELALPYRSPENVHDNYTPLFLEPTGKQIKIDGRFGYGWNAVSAGLNGGPKALNWPKAVRGSKRHCYAYYGDSKEWIKALGDVVAAPASADRQLEMITKFLRNTPDKEGAAKNAFVFNSEGDSDIPHLKFRKGADQAFVLASGFKAKRLLESVGFHAGAEVVTYDYSEPALALRKLAIAELGGKDYGSFFMAARAKINAQFESKVSYLPVPLLKDAASVDQEFQREMGSVFTSPEHWLAHWQRYKALKHSFVAVDVYRGPGRHQDHARGPCQG